MLGAALWAVAKGIKPGYLCDEPRITPQRLVGLAPQAAVVCLRIDHPIFGRGSLAACMALGPGALTCHASMPILVYVGGAAPCLLPADSTAATILQASHAAVLAAAQVGCVNSVDIPKTCSLPALVGVLLGYPVVYWTDPVSDHNCLADVTLLLVELAIAMPASDTAPGVLVPVTKFSVPAALTECCCPAISTWREQLVARLASSQQGALKHAFHEKLVTLPQVAL